MKGSDRPLPRRLTSYALVAALAVVAISCNEAHPNTTLVPHSDPGRELDFLWARLLLVGTIANVIYIPVGRTVNFRLRSADVIRSFWTPQLVGKRDVVTNRTNYLWYTPDTSISGNVWNGFCVEYCGASHANMRFRVFTV